jgi:hypothetical protein
MATRGAAVNKTALAKARERRRELDRERDAQDERIEEATAKTLVTLEGLAEAEAARDAAAAVVGEAVRALLAEDVTPERAAALLDVDVTEVRRLSKVAVVEPPSTVKPSSKAGAAATAPAGPPGDGTARVTALPEQSGSADATRRAG